MENYKLLVGLFPKFEGYTPDLYDEDTGYTYKWDNKLKKYIKEEK